ncbi:MAG TPA: hypothetical protein VH300_05420 [Thermoleophilaceae bacterium]|nr:hypothetical protein [Thermoleophilaceae bacterium]
MRLVWLVLMLSLSLALSACGAGGSGSSDFTPTPPKVPSIAQFPKVRGRTMNALAANVQGGLVLAPSVSLLLPGTNRFGFGLFDRQRKQVTDASGAIYIARGPNSRAHGPYVARWESLEVKGHYLSKTVATDPNAAQTLYVANVPFRTPGKYVVLGLFRLDNRLIGAGTTVEVVKDSKVPAVGQPAIKVDTPTKDSVGGDLSKIDTRDPHDDMHDDNLADVLGKRPVVLLFATPALCASRVCGPVVDIAEQVRHNRPQDDTAWIHMEIYNNNQVSDGYRPQFLAYHLPQEPWLFVIDRKGKISSELQGAYSASELEKAVDAVSSKKH